jgi:hypothetical protein
MSVCTNSIYHVPSFVSNACIGVCSNVVEELVTCISHCPCAIALSCFNGAECGEMCWVNCMHIVQEGTDNVLVTFNLLQGEGLCGFDLHPLNPCTTLD